MVSHYSAISAFFSNQSVADVPWTCNLPECGSGIFAFVHPADATHTINLCSAFFVFSPASGTDSQPGTLIHESSHFNDLAGTNDDAYGQTASQALALSTPVNAVANADSHQYFAENDPFRSMGNMRPNATAQTLSVAAGQPIAITLAGTDADGNPLTYAIVTPPTHGTLTGTAPALTYTSTAAAATSDSFTFQASDALSTSAPATVTINISAPLDTEGPTIVATPDRAANGAGWYSAPVIYSFTCNDPSGVSACPSPLTVSANGANQSFTVSAADRAGNSRSLVVNGINIDATAPTVTVTGVTNGATYPTGAVPVAACSTTDVLSGVAAAAVLAVSGGPASFSASCSGATDVAGNAQTAPVIAIYTVTPPPDTTPPTITPTVVGTLGSGGWYVSNVNVSWAITDPESTITTTACAPTAVTTDTPGVVITCSARSAGGTSTSSVTVKRDASPPISTVTGLTAGATYVEGSVPGAACASTDTGGSLIATSATLNWSPGLPTTPGAYVASCSGAIDGAGNLQAAASTVSINVVAAAVNRADLATSIACTVTSQKSGSTTCTVTVSNSGPAAATATRAVLTLSDGVKVTAAGSATRLGDGLLAWNAGSIVAGSSATLTITVRATDGRGRIVAAAASQTPDPNLLNNAAMANVQRSRDD